MTASLPLFGANSASPAGFSASADDLHALLEQQQAAHHADPLPSLRQRLERLDRLQRMLEHTSQIFIDAISADFGHRSAHETRMAEILVVELELRHTRKHLGRWMKARRMPTAMSYLPGSNRLMPQPLGVVGVVSPWNYPLQLALAPALGALAAGWRAQRDLPLIAVTGSNGKTTVTQMIAAVLRAWKGDAALATQGNFNNDVGVPLTLLRLRPGHEAAVVELGMNHPGEIAYLADLARPTVALVNNAQREHLEFMHTVDAVAA